MAIITQDELKNKYKLWSFLRSVARGASSFPAGLRVGTAVADFIREANAKANNALGCAGEWKSGDSIAFGYTERRRRGTRVIENVDIDPYTIELIDE